MTRPDPRNLERLMDLLADRATVGLSPDERAELAALLAGEPGFDADSFDRAAAALASGLVAPQPDVDPLPASLRSRLESQGADAVAANKSSPDSFTLPAASARPSSSSQVQAFEFKVWGGWFVAAACLALAVFLWKQPANVPSAPTPADIRAIAAAAGTVTKDWSVWPAKPEGENGQPAPYAARVMGKVVWNQQLQKGYMVFSGMPSNDPKTSQYQLWIIDKAQKNPIDGGVFDIPTASALNEIIVPIDAKLPVKDLVGFGVTVEPPGGVVVSDQSQRVVIAIPGP